jgi:hypothetical protein
VIAQTLKRKVSYANNSNNRVRSDYNCWGATQFVLGFAKRLRWIENHEMYEWLNENTHRIYRPSKWGDILAIYYSDADDRPWGLKHTAVYMGNGQYFHKRGACPAQIVTLKEIKETYSGVCVFTRIND